MSPPSPSSRRWCRRYRRRKAEQSIIKKRHGVSLFWWGNGRWRGRSPGRQLCCRPCARSAQVAPTEWALRGFAARGLQGAAVGEARVRLLCRRTAVPASGDGMAAAPLPPGLRPTRRAEYRSQRAEPRGNNFDEISSPLPPGGGFTTLQFCSRFRGGGHSK